MHLLHSTQCLVYSITNDWQMLQKKVALLSMNSWYSFYTFKDCPLIFLVKAIVGSVGSLFVTIQVDTTMPKKLTAYRIVTKTKEANLLPGRSTSYWAKWTTTVKMNDANMYAVKIQDPSCAAPGFPSNPFLRTFFTITMSVEPLAEADCYCKGVYSSTILAV